MLVLVCGPTGVGKTTLMTRLARAGMGVVSTWTTRPPRANDPFKHSLSETDYRTAYQRFFWPEQSLYGHLYGEDYAQLMAASCPRAARTWLLDMALDTLWLFDRVPHRTLLLLPDGPGYLATTLAAAGRPERAARAVAEEEEWRAALTAGRFAEAAVLACRLGGQATVAEAAARAIAAWAAVGLSISLTP